MASITKANWRAILNRTGSNRRFATSTAPRMKSFPSVVEDLAYDPKPLKGEFVPVYVALGMITLSAALGLHAAIHQLARAPNVFVRKTKRETVPEVFMPDEVAKDARKFIHKSAFRKIVHVQNKAENVIPDPIRGNALVSPKKMESLKSVGVDPLAQSVRL